MFQALILYLVIVSSLYYYNKPLKKWAKASKDKKYILLSHLVKTWGDSLLRDLWPWYKMFASKQINNMLTNNANEMLATKVTSLYLSPNVRKCSNCCNNF